MLIKHNKNNLVFIYTGHGKGKTTAGLGLAARALRDGMKVQMVQFVKSSNQSGEVSLNSVLPGMKVKCFGKGFVSQKAQKTQKHFRDSQTVAKEGIGYCVRLVKSTKFNVLILDEVFVALDLKLIKQSDIMRVIREFRGVSNKSNKGFFLVMTGRSCPKSLYKYADLVTEMKEVKHPFKNGLLAVKGIDY